MSYTAKKVFSVYVLNGRDEKHNERDLYKDTHTQNEYEDYDTAVEWIQQNGNRTTGYTVLEVFKKP